MNVETIGDARMVQCLGGAACGVGGGAARVTGAGCGGNSRSSMGPGGFRWYTFCICCGSSGRPGCTVMSGALCAKGSLSCGGGYLLTSAGRLGGGTPRVTTGGTAGFAPLVGAGVVPLASGGVVPRGGGGEVRSPGGTLRAAVAGWAGRTTGGC